MKVGAIDIGTNSIRLLMINFLADDYNIIGRETSITRLGEDVDKTKILKSKAIARTYDVFKDYYNQIKKNNIANVKIVGTSALRDVSNAKILADKIKEYSGLGLKVISGKKEAEYIYSGVKLDLRDEDFLIIDIGGGSTEFIWRQDNILNFESLNIGAVRLTERYISRKDKKMSLGEKKSIINNIETKINKLKNIELTNINNLVGVGGTIANLAAMDQKLLRYQSDKIHLYKLPYKKINKIIKELIHKNLAEKKEMPGLQSGRADIITTGALILKLIMKRINLDHIKVSEHDILFGIARDAINI